MNVYDCLFIKPSELSVFSSDGGLDLCSQHTPTLQHQSSDSFDCTKKSILKPRKTKSLLAKFSYPKKLSQNGKFGAPKNLSIIPFTLTSEYPPPLPSLVLPLWHLAFSIIILFLKVKEVVKPLRNNLPSKKTASPNEQKTDRDKQSPFQKQGKNSG